MPEKHALLSASSAARWLNCPPSARLCAGIEDKGSEYAAEGTLAHSMCEVKLTGYFSAVGKRTTTSKLNKLKKDKLYQPEMDGYTDYYADYVKKTALSFSGKATVRIEEQVDYGSYAPEGFGTADCLILFGNELHVIDFKYGRGVAVAAENNPQLKLYALGAMEKFALLYSPEKIVLHIVQPRIDNISSWETSAADIRDWGESIKPTAQSAFEGKGEFHSGEHCRFCKISGSCRKRAEDNLSLAQYEFRKPQKLTSGDAPTLSDSEVGEVLTMGAQLKKWYEDIEKYALGAILDGKKLSGWKAVEGRSTRAFSDADAVPQRLISLGLSDELAFERKMLTPPQLEKILGKDDFAQSFGDIVVKSKGKPTLAPESDKRPEYTAGTTAGEDFGEDIPF